jgi:carbamoyl-phosphate synthase small subunit
MVGEVVFTTSLVGYPESMSDPSYRGQILLFTQPLIGNYGIPDQSLDRWGLLNNFESDRVQVQGIIVNDYATRYSHRTAVESLGEWCARHDIPAVTGVDTRAIVHLLRDQGSTLGRISVGPESHADTIEGVDFPDPNLRNLVSEVSTKAPYEVNSEGATRVLLIDCGLKQNIIRCLVTRGAAVTVVPWDHDISAIASQYDGIFISNGPGNPAHLRPTVNNVRRTLTSYTGAVFGICMGNLVLGMAAGFHPYKLRFGNRGHNQPALNMLNGRCAITSQNHGYALDDSVPPAGWEKFWMNANDYTNEGIRHKDLPFMSVQFHPEAKGGPEDTEFLFDDFLEMARASRAKREGTKVFVPLSAAHAPSPVVVM